MRCIGQVTDFVKLYEYSGRASYLDQAERLWTRIPGLPESGSAFQRGGRAVDGQRSLRSRRQFRVQASVREVVHRPVRDELLPYLLAYRPDDKRLRDTIVACNDWMAKVQTAGGGWSYPGPTTAGFRWSIEYCHGLMLGYEVEPKPAYLDAIQRDLRAIAALLQKHGAIPGSVTPWEYLAGKTAADLGQMYRLGSDRDRNRDFTDGRSRVSAFPADQAVYLQVLSARLSPASAGGVAVHEGRDPRSGSPAADLRTLEPVTGRGCALADIGGGVHLLARRPVCLGPN